MLMLAFFAYLSSSYYKTTSHFSLIEVAIVPYNYLYVCVYQSLVVHFHNDSRLIQEVKLLIELK